MSLPLLWFDRLLRYYGALLPAPILALRAASVLLTPGAQERVANGSASTTSAGEPAAWLWRRREFGEALVVYGGVTVVRWWVYGLHQAGTPYAVACTMTVAGTAQKVWLVLCLGVSQAVSSRQPELSFNNAAKRISCERSPCADAGACHGGILSFWHNRDSLCRSACRRGGKDITVWHLT